MYCWSFTAVAHEASPCNALNVPVPCAGVPRVVLAFWFVPRLTDRNMAVQRFNNSHRAARIFADQFAECIGHQRQRHVNVRPKRSPFPLLLVK